MSSNDFGAETFGMPPEVRRDLFRSGLLKEMMRVFPLDDIKWHMMSVGVPILHQPGQKFEVKNKPLAWFPHEEGTPENIYTLDEGSLLFMGWAFDERAKGHIPLFIHGGKTVTFAHPWKQARTAFTIESLMHSELIAQDDNDNYVGMTIDGGPCISYRPQHNPSWVLRIPTLTEEEKKASTWYNRAGQHVR